MVLAAGVGSLRKSSSEGKVQEELALMIVRPGEVKDKQQECGGKD